MNKDKRLFLFPIISGIFSILFVLAMVFPSIILPSLTSNQGLAEGINWIIVFGIYFGLAFIATFFNVGVVYIIKNTLDNKKVSFGDAMKFAFSRIGIILAWSLISATVGLILRILDEVAERIGGIGEIIIKVLTSIIGGVWSIMTLFVVPVMVYEKVGPFKAISRSVETLKKTWGETLIKQVGVGLMAFLFILLGIIATILGIILLSTLGTIVLLVFIVIMVIYFMAIISFFSVANNVYNTALYVYGNTGTVPLGFDQNIVQNSFSEKKE
jgi:hypothetical protein